MTASMSNNQGILLLANNVLTFQKGFYLMNHKWQQRYLFFYYGLLINYWYIRLLVKTLLSLCAFEIFFTKWPMVYAAPDQKAMRIP